MLERLSPTIISAVTGRDCVNAMESKLMNMADRWSPHRQLLVVARSQILATQVVAPAFRSRGWEVDVSELTLDVLRSVNERNYDLIIMQVVHPNAESFSLCEALRERSRAPLLLVFAAAASGDVIQGFRKGADAYVVEPFDMRELLVRAEALVRRSEGRVRQGSVSE